MRAYARKIQPSKTFDKSLRNGGAVTLARTPTGIGTTDKPGSSSRPRMGALLFMESTMRNESNEATSPSQVVSPEAAPSRTSAARLADDVLQGLDAIAEYEGINKRRAQYLVATRQLPAYQVGNRWCMRRSTRLRQIAELESRVLA